MSLPLPHLGVSEKKGHPNLGVLFGVLGYGPLISETPNLTQHLALLVWTRLREAHADQTCLQHDFPLNP